MSKRFTVEQTTSGRWTVTDHHHRFHGGRVIAVEYAKTRALHKAARMNEAHETAEYKRRAARRPEGVADTMSRVARELKES